MLKGNANQVVATGRKRKSDGGGNGNGEEDDVAATSQHLNLFATLSDENWNLISSFAAPPDVYNLALSSVHFFHEVSSCSVNKPVSSSKTVRRSRRLAEAAAPAETKNDDKKVLATQLLRTSLLSSLEKVLEKSDTRITLDALSKIPEGSALIAGSTMVAACLGKDWSADIDVYCSAAAAPQVRSVRFVESNARDYVNYLFLMYDAVWNFYSSTLCCSGWWKRLTRCSSD